jgi:hypothetical protein
MSWCARSHWLNVPILLGLILSGVSIYWSSPIYQHKPDPTTGNFDVAADIGIWICARVAGQHHYASSPEWIYNHMSLGPGMLGPALRLHWLYANAFMLNGLMYAAGSIAGGGGGAGYYLAEPMFSTRTGCSVTTSDRRWPS